MFLCAVFTRTKPSMSAHDYAVLLGYTESSAKGWHEQSVKASEEVSRGPSSDLLRVPAPPGGLPPASPFSCDLLLNFFPSFPEGTVISPPAFSPFPSAAQW